MTRVVAILLVFFEAAYAPLVAQTATAHGIVTDSATGAPLARVRVTWSAETGSFSITSLTNANGAFTSVRLPRGRYAVVASRVGYRLLRLNAVEVRDSVVNLRMSLSAVAVPLDRVVVSVARSEQPWLDAPASVSVIGRSDIEADMHFSPLEQIRTLPGVDLASKGINQHTFEVRGPRGPVSGALLMLTDYRYAEVPSLGFNISTLVPATREDIDRIELARGPVAALYGPGGQRGVLHVITRSPFESAGGSVSVTVGERSVRQATWRYASIVHPSVALSFSGNYFRGDNWPFTDSVEVANRDQTISQGADPDTLLIGRRDDATRVANGEARLDWRLRPSTEIVAKSGLAEEINNIEVAANGAVQVRHWRSSYVQTWLRHNGVFANVFYNMSDAGDTYFLRTGAPLVDKSRLVALQLQNATHLRGVDLVYGSDVRWTDPRTGGTVNGQYEENDRLTEGGAYAQATTAFVNRFQLVGAVRADYHSVLESVVLAPRAGIVFKPTPSQALRLTYNRALSSPPPIDLFQDVRLGALPGSARFGLRARGIPPGGLTFRRDCDGLCMRSPFNPAGSAAYLAVGATALWSAIVADLQKRGVDLSDVPSPTNSQVATNLAAFNRATGAFVPVVAGDVRDIEALRREITNVLEIGYKARLRRASVATDVWITKVRNRLAPRPTSVTPNVFFDRATLEKYLSGFRSAAAAATVAQMISKLPIGTVSPQEVLEPVDVLFVRQQGQKYTLTGFDMDGELLLNPSVSVAANYSWASNDSLASGLPGIPVVLNLPRSKGSLRIEYRDSTRLTAALSGRAVSSFSGNVATYHQSRIAGYGVVDFYVARNVGSNHNVTVSADVQNLFDNSHCEVPGAPWLGRLATVRVRTTF